MEAVTKAAIRFGVMCACIMTSMSNALFIFTMLSVWAGGYSFPTEEMLAWIFFAPNLFIPLLGFIMGYSMVMAHEEELEKEE